MKFKREISLLLIAILALGILTACSEKTVEVKIPKELFTDEGLKEDGKLEKGIKDIIEKDDEVVIVMTEEKHKEILTDIKEGVSEEFKSIVESEDMAYIKDIKYDEDMKNIDIIMDKKLYEEAFDVSFFVAGMHGLTYQIYNQSEPNVKINYVEETSGETFFSMNFPEDLEETLRDQESEVEEGQEEVEENENK